VTRFVPLEQSFQSVVIEVARLTGWRVAHFRAARTAHGWRTPVTADGAGWPDLVPFSARSAVLGPVKWNPDGVWLRWVLHGQGTGAMNETGLPGCMNAKKFGVPKWMLKWKLSNAVLGPKVQESGPTGISVSSGVTTKCW
jgi:hypothetical protein